MSQSRASRSQGPTSWSEWLLDTGKQVAQSIKRGACIEEVSNRLRLPMDTCKLAAVFFNSDDVLKLRALFEDWQQDQLLVYLGAACLSVHEKRAIRIKVR